MEMGSEKTQQIRRSLKEMELRGHYNQSFQRGNPLNSALWQHENKTALTTKSIFAGLKNAQFDR
jgi:hypothetical protein